MLARYDVTQIGSQLNALLKEIGKKKKVRRTIVSHHKHLLMRYNRPRKTPAT